MKKLILISGALLAFTITPANAGTSGKTSLGWKLSHYSWIREGRCSRELTRAETTKLAKEDRKIQIENRIDKEDKTVSPREMRFLRREQNRHNRQITREIRVEQGKKSGRL